MIKPYLFLISFSFILFFSFLQAEEDISTLIKKLGHSSWDIRENATQDLLAIGEKALKDLKEAAKSKDLEIAWRAKYILSFSNIRVGNSLNNTITHRTKEIKENILKLYNSNPTSVFMGKKELKKIGRPALGFLQAELRICTNRIVQNRLKRLITEIQQQNQQPISEKKPKNPTEQRFRVSLKYLYNPNMRTFGVELIKAMKEEALPYLIEEVKKKSQDYQARGALIRILREIKKKEAVDCLVDLTEDSDNLISNTAHLSLRRLTGEKSISRFRWKEWWKKKKATYKFPSR